MLNARLCFTFLAFGAATQALGAAAALPDWLLPVLTPEAQAWRPEDSAVVLLRDRTVRYLPQNAATDTHRGAIRMHQAASLDLARVGVGYDANNDRIVSATAYIVGPDRKQTLRLGRDQFIDHALAYNRYFWDAQRVIDFLGGDRVPLDGILAWEIVVERHPGFNGDSEFFLPAATPTYRTTFSVTPVLGEHLEWFTQDDRLRHPLAEDENGTLLWKLDRLRPVPLERPERFLPNRLGVFVRSDRGRSESWQSFGQQASAIIDPRIDSTGPVKALADSLVAGKFRRWDRIRALSEWVQTQIVYLAISLDKDNLAGYRPHAPAEILRNRFGDCKDKATLLVSMLRAVGEDGHVVLLYSGDPRMVESQWPMAEFNHAIVALPADGAEPGWPLVTLPGGQKMVIFDPTDSGTPLGVLPGSDQGGFALVLAASGGSIVQLPMADPDRTRLERLTRAKLDANGRLEATVAELGTGYVGAVEYANRAGKSAEVYRQSIEARLHRTHPSIANLQPQEQWDPARSTYRLEYTFASPGYAKTVGSMLLVRPAVLPSTAHLREWKLPAWDGVAEVSPSIQEDETRLEIPAGYAVEEMPDPWQQASPAASARLDYKVEGSTVIFHSHFQRKGAFYNKADYESLRLLYLALEDQERRPILLRRAQ